MARRLLYRGAEVTTMLIINEGIAVRDDLLTTSSASARAGGQRSSARLPAQPAGRFAACVARQSGRNLLDALVVGSAATMLVGGALSALVSLW